MTQRQSISIRIDGELIDAEIGQTVFEVAEHAAKFIPALCRLKGLSPVGACRLCVVELDSVNRLVTSCTTLVQEGMRVTTRSSRIDSYRRMVIELILAEGNHVCATCVSNNHCELQTLAVKLGVTNIRYNYAFRKRGIDMSHPRFVLDHNRCILCTRCVRVCAEVEGARVWDVMGRGSASRTVAEMNRQWGEAESCTNCGKCVLVCPTGALAEKGYATSEMVKNANTIVQLSRSRGSVSR